MSAVPEAASNLCSNPDCRIAQDGRCVEGLQDPASCSHYGKPVTVVEVVDPTSTKVHRPGIRLPDADALSTAAAQQMLRSKPCNVVAIVGPHDAGKTSLVGGIYDLLQLDVVGRFGFAGSTTLHAFERACHDSRSASNRLDPHMERTDRGEVTYFHLDLAPVDLLGCKRAVLFANRDGEAYMDTQASPELATRFVELSRCDTLTVLADGKKLLGDGDRHQVSGDVTLTLRAFLEAGQTRKWQQLAIVLTKIDEVRSDKINSERAMRDFDRIVSDVRAEFGADFLEIRGFSVAASPKVGTAERGEGMAELLGFWMHPPARMKHGATDSAVAPPSTRAFSRLGMVPEGRGRG